MAILGVFESHGLLCPFGPAARSPLSLRTHHAGHCDEPWTHSCRDVALHECRSHLRGMECVRRESGERAAGPKGRRGPALQGMRRMGTDGRNSSGSAGIYGGRKEESGRIGMSVDRACGICFFNSFTIILSHIEHNCRLYCACNEGERNRFCSSSGHLWYRPYEKVMAVMHPGHRAAIFMAGWIEAQVCLNWYSFFAGFLILNRCRISERRNGYVRRKRFFQ